MFDNQTNSSMASTVSLEDILRAGRAIRELKGPTFPEVFVFRRREYEQLKCHTSRLPPSVVAIPQKALWNHIGYIMGTPFYIADTEEEWAYLCGWLAFVKNKRVGMIESE